VASAHVQHQWLSRISRNLLVFSAFLAMFGRVSWARPQETPRVTDPPPPRNSKPFSTKLFAEQMDKLHIPGAVFVLVKDGRIFFAKGYGDGDLERKTTVDPDRTAFRVASISKLFTATAVMQLWGTRKLKFDDMSTSI
jgi:CubicO group peptidase (beta-lactamase class C family)